MTTTAKPMTKAQALAEPSAELLMNGKCVGKLEYGDHGTCLVMTWHEAGCEHDPELEQAARSWLADCGLRQPGNSWDLRATLEANYVGGWAQFVADGS